MTSECRHVWVIDSLGRTGRCKRCGQEKAYPIKGEMTRFEWRTQLKQASAEVRAARAQRNMHI